MGASGTDDEEGGRMSDEYCGGTSTGAGLGAGAGVTGIDGAKALGTVGGAAAEPFAACVLCREPSEYPESYRGITLCPVCQWQEAQRTACSG